MKTIWNRLLLHLKNEYAVAGIMGNLEAESGLKSSNLQNSYEKVIGMNDAQYTAAVNSKSYSKNSFYSDHAGYGLAQWTYWSRKKMLYEFIFDSGYGDISSVDGQIDFLFAELNQSYGSVLRKLLASTSVKEASDIFCKEYERPANQSEANLLARSQRGEKWYNKYHATNSCDDFQEELKTIYQCLLRMGFKN